VIITPAAYVCTHSWGPREFIQVIRCQRPLWAIIGRSAPSNFPAARGINAVDRFFDDRARRQRHQAGAQALRGNTKGKPLSVVADIQIIGRKPHASTGLNGWISFENHAIQERSDLPHHSGFPSI
jgi:hypothetical protein